MAATYITMSELRTLLGIGSLYSDATVEECAQAAEDYVKSFLWFNTAPVVGQKLVSNVATLYTPTPHTFVKGDTVVITKLGAHYNGSKTITAVGYNWIEYTTTGNNNDEPYHTVAPYGLITGAFHATDYATVPAVREATATVAVTIWQSRQAPGASVATIDGFVGSPYQLGNTLLAKIRGLIAPYLAPAGMIN